MNTQPYNKSASRQGSFVHEQVIAPARGAAYNNMDWHKYFTYKPETGNLIWKERTTLMCGSEKQRNAWNSRNAHTFAGKISKTNWPYTAVRLNGSFYGAHRIIWEMHHGPIPKGMQIDHIDRDPLNNRVQNLRLATPAQNQANRRVHKNSTTGRKGVTKVGDRYHAKIQFNKRPIHIGCYLSLDEAAQAYEDKAIELYGDFARFMRPNHQTLFP